MRHVVLVVFLAAASAAPAVAQVADRLDDLRLATAVRLALVDDVRTRALDVTVTARDGAVRLDGALGDRRTVADVARAVPGVRWLEGVGEPAPGPVVSVRERAAERPADPPPVRSDGEAVYHTVRPGDTLFSLARRYGTTVEAIRALNGRGSASIRVGERLRVR